MTMKTKRTLQHIAAVAVVLLTLCLVFMMPVGATEGEEKVISLIPEQNADAVTWSGSTCEIDLDNAAVADKYVLSKDFTGIIKISGNTARSITLTSNDNVKLYGYIWIAPDNGWNVPFDVTINRMSTFVNSSIMQQIGKSGEIWGVLVQTPAQVGPHVKVNLLNNEFTFDKDLASTKSYMFKVDNGGVISGSKFIGNNASEVTAHVFSIAGATYSDTVEVKNNVVTMSPIENNKRGFFKIYHNDKNSAKYLIEGNEITVLGQNIASIVQADETTGDFSDTEIELRDNTITEGNAVFRSNAGHTYSTFKSFTATNPVNIAQDISGGTVTVSSESAKNGETVTITATPYSGYSVGEISATGDITKEDIDLSENHFVMPYESVTVTGSFEAISYTVTVTGGSANTETATVGTEISLTADEPESGFVFKGWQVISGGVTITGNEFTMPAANVEITAVFEEKKEEPVTPPTEVTPSIGAVFSEDDKTITPSTGTTAEAFTEEEMEEIPIDADDIVGIYDESNPSVVLVVTDATIDVDGMVSFSENSVVLAAYPEISSAVDSESEDAEEAVSVVVLIGMEKPDSDSLPSFSGEFKDEVAEAVESVSDKDYKPLSMITATAKVDEINANRASEKGAIGIAFTISDDLYQKYKGKFVALHVKEGKVADTIQVTATLDEETCNWNLEISGDSFSSYVLAVDNTPKPEYTPTGGATDTGSGNYQYYPRDVPTNGIVDFGTSKVITGMELPAGSSGKVTLNIKPDFAMPENGFYAFEIDAPGYNLDAKINGGLSFQIPVADLEAEGFTANDIVLFHGTVAEDGKITWEALPTNLVKVENGIAYYKAAINGCSPFYIGFVEDGSIVNTEVVDPVTPPTDEPQDVPGEVLPEIPPVDEPETPASPAPILAVLAGLGAAVVLRRK